MSDGRGFHAEDALEESFLMAGWEDGGALEGRAAGRVRRKGSAGLRGGQVALE